MVDKLWFLIPEMWLFAGVVVISVMGLCKARGLRNAVPLVVIGFLAVAFIITPLLYTDDRLAKVADGLLIPMLGRYVKMVVCAIGIVLAMLSVGLIDRP